MFITINLICKFQSIHCTANFDFFLLKLIFSLCCQLVLLINLVTFPAGGEEPHALRAAKDEEYTSIYCGGGGAGQGKGGVGTLGLRHTHQSQSTWSGVGQSKGVSGVTSWANVWRYWSLGAIVLLRWCHGWICLSGPRFQSFFPSSSSPSTVRILGSHVALEYKHLE